LTSSANPSRSISTQENIHLGEGGWKEKRRKIEWNLSEKETSSRK